MFFSCFSPWASPIICVHRNGIEYHSSTLSCPSSSFNPTLSMSLLQESFHLVFSLPLHLFPGTGTSTVLLSTCHSSLLLTCPYNFSLLSVTCYATGITFTDPLTCYATGITSNDPLTCYATGITFTDPLTCYATGITSNDPLTCYVTGITSNDPLTCYVTGITFTDPLTCSLLILSFFVTPHIHRSILISFTSSLFAFRC